MMRNLIVGTAGHIDHGKSALVRALTGIDPDRLKEEKIRGITIDLGFAHAVTGDVHLAFVDVPGHERFVKNMLAGVGGIDCVLLVIAADESVMPQTREHLDICRLLRVPAGVIAVTKSDLVDRDTIDLVRLEARELVAGSFLEGAPAIPVSVKTGEGLDALQAALADLGHASGGRPVEGATRLPIDRIFSMRGFGTVVTGTLVSGRLTVDQALVALPRNREVKVRGIQVHGTKQREAVAGQRAAVNLAGIEVTDLGRGDSLVLPGAFEPTRVIDGVLELLASARALGHGARIRFHQGTGEALGRVAVVGALVSETTEAGRTSRVLDIQPGTRAYARLRLESPVVVTRGDRYVLRAYSPPVTIAGGWVLDPHPPRGGVRTAAALARFARLDSEPRTASGPIPAEEQRERDDRAVAAMIDERGAAGLRVSELTSRAGLQPSAVKTTIGRLAERGYAARVGTVLLAPSVLAALKQRLIARLQGYHDAQPLSDGMPREEARARLFAGADAAVFEHVVVELAAEQRIIARDRLALATHQLVLSPEEARARTHVERAFRDAGLMPPDPAEIVASSGAPAELVDRMIKLLVRHKVLVKVDRLLFHEAALGRLKCEVAALKGGVSAQPARLDVAAFKERYGITRKFAIPLLEYLDRERVTRRVGETRLVV